MAAITSGDYLKVRKTQEYYKEASDKSAIERIQRVVNKCVINPVESTPTHTESPVSNGMAEAIKKVQTRYSEKVSPEERKQRKFDAFVDTGSESDDQINLDKGRRMKKGGRTIPQHLCLRKGKEAKSKTQLKKHTLKCVNAPWELWIK